MAQVPLMSAYMPERIRKSVSGWGPLEESFYVQGHRPVRRPLLTPGTTDRQRRYCGHLGPVL